MAVRRASRGGSAMKSTLQRFACALTLCALQAVSALAQSTPTPAADRSAAVTIEAIQSARVSTRILYITAHPDDESVGLLPYLAHGLGADVCLLTITRGQGGQNAIGPELGAQLAVIRSSELLEAAHHYGVKLYFTRAPDFGFSKTLDETLRIWGDTALADMVRVIRTLRPNIVINGWGNVRGGHGNHQASGFLTPKAFAMAADPKAFPDQLAEGLEPWQADLLLQPGRGDEANSVVIPTDDISPTWGYSYRQIGIDARAIHRSQGTPGAQNAGPFFLRGNFTLIRADGGKFDAGVLARGLSAIADEFPAFSAALRPPLESAEKSVEEARHAALLFDFRGAARALGSAGRQVQSAQEKLNGQDARQVAHVKRELAAIKERIDAALAAVAGVQIVAQASRPEFVAGESFTVRADARARTGVLDDVGKPALALPEGWSVSKEETDQAGSTRFTVDVPKSAQTPHPPAEWMFPFAPPLLTAHVRGGVEGYAFETSVPVTGQRVSPARVDTISPILAPAVTLAIEPRQFLVKVKQAPKALEVLARVHYYGTSPAKITTGLDVPEGWRVAVPAPLDFSSQGDQFVRFVVTPPAKVSPANYPLKAWGSRDSEKFSTTLEPLPSLPTFLWSEPAVATAIALDLTVPEGLRIGYVAAENDLIPAAIERLGLHLELLDPPALAFGDLSRFDAIIIGVRAYDLRPDLARANQRLLDYAAAGGTLVVQYQRNPGWDRLKPAPFPASMPQGGDLRVTDETSAVKFLLPDHSLLNFPNKITQADFDGWVQDRAFYSWGQFDPRYQAILATHDPGEQDITGTLVYARTGKGVYIYTSLAFIRQLPEGVPGAYRLFVNLISQSRAKP
jgi:LmbE family N-acetylglucosaminyl deacetylase